MAVSVKGDSADPMVDPNVIPLVDIMLVLLIIFIITIPVMTHAVKIDLPRDNPNPPTEEPPSVVKIYVEFDGTHSLERHARSTAPTFRDYVAIENARIRSRRFTWMRTGACPTSTSPTCCSRCSAAACRRSASFLAKRR